MHRIGIQPDSAQRRIECICIGQCQAANGDPMGRAEQHHATDARRDVFQGGVGAGGDGTGIDIPGVRADQGFRIQGARLRPVQESLHVLRELPRVVRIEHSGHGGCANCRHGYLLFSMFLIWRRIRVNQGMLQGIRPVYQFADNVT